MCLIAIRREPGRIVIAANRDEAFTRPTRVAHIWKDAPQVMGGRDRLHGGSWLAVTSRGRFAAVTNLRGGRMEGGPSRGLLVRDFVAGGDETLAFARRVAGRGGEYAGFHWVGGDVQAIVHYSNGAGEPRVVDDEVLAISNGPLEDEWPKMARARAFLQGKRTADELMSFLATREDDVFVVSPEWGTRSSTVILATPDGAELFERNYGPGGKEEGTEIRLALRAG